MPSNDDVEGSTTHDQKSMPTVVAFSTPGEKSSPSGNNGGKSGGGNSGGNGGGNGGGSGTNGGGGGSGNGNNNSKGPSNNPPFDGGFPPSGGGKGKGDSDSASDSDSDDDDDEGKGQKTNTNAAFSPGGDNPCENINDNDGRLQYTGVWTLESKDPNGFYFTSHTTTTIGSQASIFFNGTSITVTGTVHASNYSVPPAAAAYIIDDDTSIELPLPLSDRDIPHQTFFESPDLLLGTHRLVINITTDGSPYTLNSLTVCSKATGSIATVLTPSTRPTHKLTHAAIAGIIVGSISFLFLSCLLSIFLLRRRRRRLRAARTADSPITKWLDSRLSGTLFTSSESILRNTPTNPSAIGSDGYDKVGPEKPESANFKALPATPHPFSRHHTLEAINRASMETYADWIRALHVVNPDHSAAHTSDEAHHIPPSHPPILVPHLAP